VGELENLPAEMPANSRIETLGEIYAVMKPFVVVSPASSLAILDIGSPVACSDSLKIIGMVFSQDLV
jgi:hypothetical protein